MIHVVSCCLLQCLLYRLLPYSDLVVIVRVVSVDRVGSVVEEELLLLLVVVVEVVVIEVVVIEVVVVVVVEVIRARVPAGE